MYRAVACWGAGAVGPAEFSEAEIIFRENGRLTKILYSQIEKTKQRKRFSKIIFIVIIKQI